jgi:hypothetical protein
MNIVRKKYFYLLILLILSISACNKHNIDTTLSLNPERIQCYPVDEINNFSYFGLKASDNLLLISDWSSDSGLFYVYNYPQFELLEFFGTKGEGPGEYLEPFILMDIVPPGPSLNFTAVDLNRKILGNYDLSYHNGQLKGTQSDSIYKIPDQIFPSWFLTISAAKTIGTGVGTDYGLFYIYDRVTNKKKWIDYFPIINLEGSRSHLYTSKVVYNESKSVVFCAMKFFDRFLFYNDDGILNKIISTGSNVMPKYGVNEFSLSGSSRYYATDVYGTNNFIYILWSGYTQDDYDNERTLNSTIIVLDWSGNLVDSFIVPKSVLVAASPNDSHIFIVSNENGKNQKVQFFRTNFQ